MADGTYIGTAVTGVKTDDFPFRACLASAETGTSFMGGAGAAGVEEVISSFAAFAAFRFSALSTDL